MNLKILMIGAATVGLLATTGMMRAMPAAPLGSAFSNSNTVKTHYSRYRHLHRHNHIVWLSGPRSSVAATEGGVSAGRSVSKHRQRSKSLEQNAPSGGPAATQGRSVKSPPPGAARSSSQPSGNAPSQGPQKGSSQKGGGGY